MTFIKMIYTMQIIINYYISIDAYRFKMLLISCMMKIFLFGLTLLVAGSVSAVTPSVSKDSFKVRPLPSLPETTIPSLAWRSPQGWVTEQHGNFHLLTEGAARWTAIPVDSPISIGPSVITTSADGKLYIVDGRKVCALEYTAGGMVSTNLTDLPVALSQGAAQAVRTTLYVAGIDARGSNTFFRDSVALTPWSEKPARRVLLAQSQYMLYLFADEDGSGKLAAYAFNNYDKTWKRLGVSSSAMEAEVAFACGDAHILFLGRHSQKLQGFYITQKAWVEFELPALPRGPFAFASDYKRFVIIEPGAAHEAEAVFPGTKYGLYDHLVVAAYFVGMLWIGKRLSRREKDEADFFRGGKRLPWWALGLSLFASGASAISLMSMPAKAYAENWIYFIGGPIAILLLPFKFWIVIPIVRHLNFSSAYEYLEARYCHAFRIFGGIGFIATQILGRMAGIMVLPAIALSALCGLPIHVSILLMGVITTIYCMMGGFEAVVWTDTIQAVIEILAIALCVIWVFTSLHVPMGEVVSLVQDEQKLKMLDFSLDVTQPIFLIVVISGLLGIVGAIGDQNFIQRVQAVTNEKEARKAVATQLLVAVPFNVMLFGLGTCLYIYYHYHSGDIPPAMKADGIFPLFAAQRLPPGLSGLAVTAIISATMSVLSSALNSSSDVTLTDFVSKLRPNLTHHQRVAWGKGLTVFYGVVATSLALWLAQTNAASVWDMLLVVSGLIFSPLGCMFTMGILTTRTNTRGVVCGMVAALGTNFYANRYLHLHPFFYATIGMGASCLFAYLFSVMLPDRKPKDLTGLTVFTSSYLKLGKRGNGN